MTAITYRGKQSRLYRHRKANNIKVLTDATPSREHIQHLNNLGVTTRMISLCVDSSHQNIVYIANGTSRTIHTDLANSIRAVDHHPHPQQALVLGIGARRRIHALNAIGWATATLADYLGLSRQCIQLSIKRKRITYTRWAEIRDLYEKLSGTPGSSATSIQIAKRNGYAPPLAWDDIDIDHPHAKPDWAAAEITRAQRSECLRGHAYDTANTYRDSRGRRQCRACRRASKTRQPANATRLLVMHARV